MFKLDPDRDKNWIAWLFIVAFGVALVFAFGHYLLWAIVLYAIAKAFSTPHPHNNQLTFRKRCRGRRRCRW
jgi:hypothetical protein